MSSYQSLIFFLIIPFSFSQLPTQPSNSNATDACKFDLQNTMDCTYDEDCAVLTCVNLQYPYYVTNYTQPTCHFNRCINGTCIALEKEMSDTCKIGGCSGEICGKADSDIISTCE